MEIAIWRSKDKEHRLVFWPAIRILFSIVLSNDKYNHSAIHYSTKLAAFQSTIWEMQVLEK